MKPVVFSCLFLLSLYLVSRYLFYPANLYYDIWWLDIPMHILGGFGVASLAAAITSLRGQKVSYKNIIVLYAVVALLWEVYEYMFGFSVYSSVGDWVDSLSDFINGFIGATLSFILIKKTT